MIWFSCTAQGSCFLQALTVQWRCLPCLLQPPEKQQLFKGTQLLEDARKLAEAKVENDDVIAMVFQQDGRWMHSLFTRTPSALYRFLATSLSAHQACTFPAKTGSCPVPLVGERAAT